LIGNQVIRKPTLLWIGLLSSVLGVFYFGMSAVTYVWLNAASPDRWPLERAGMWAAGAALLCVVSLGGLSYCAVSLIRRANGQG
jgi:hypothetical protein